MQAIIGLIMMVAAVFVGLYLGIWVMFIGGIVDIIDEIKAVEVNSLNIAWGLVKMICASIVGWLSFLLLWLTGAAMIESS